MASSGNFATMNNTIQLGGSDNDRSSGYTENGNLKVNVIKQQSGPCSSIGMRTSGKYYFEVYVNSYFGGTNVALVNESWNIDAQPGWQTPSQNTSDYDLVGYYFSSGALNNAQSAGDGSNFTSYGSGLSNGSVLGIAVDVDNGKVWFHKDGTYFNSGNPATGANPARGSGGTITTAMDFTKTWFVTAGGWGQTTGIITYNFGQDSTFGGEISAGGNQDSNSHGDFKYSVPSGFTCLSSNNVPISDDIDPAQTDDDYPGKLFNTITYTGTGSSNAITGLGFQPDLVWIKKRNGSTEHKLTDSSRGVTKALQPDSINAESTDTNGLTAFGSDGFTVGSDSSYNNSSDTYVAWCWRLNGGTTVSNTSGDINSTTQANDKTGLSVVLYTGNGSQGQTIGHGLTKAPEMVWFKNRDYGTRGVSMNWIASLSTSTGSPFASLSGSSQSIKLSSNEKIQNYFRTETNFTPTTSTFSVPSNGNAPYWFNGSGDDYVAYCWHSVEGFSKFGIYTANANDDGPFIYTGFRPRMLFVKNLDENSTEWEVRDTAVNTFNPANKGIYWDQTQAEATRSEKYDILSNGFKIRTNGGPGNYNSGSNILYGAWADVPFKYNNTF